MHPPFPYSPGVRWHAAVWSARSGWSFCTAKTPGPSPIHPRSQIGFQMVNHQSRPEQTKAHCCLRGRQTRSRHSLMLLPSQGHLRHHFHLIYVGPANPTLTRLLQGPDTLPRAGQQQSKQSTSNSQHPVNTIHWSPICFCLFPSVLSLSLSRVVSPSVLNSSASCNPRSSVQ